MARSTCFLAVLMIVACGKPDSPGATDTSQTAPPGTTPDTMPPTDTDPTETGTPPTAPTPGASLGVGNFHTCVLAPPDALWCWGDNNFGEVGDGTTDDQPLPVRVTSLTGMAEVAAGNGFTCVRHDDGTASCWGYNYGGQVGNGETGASVGVPEPNVVLDLAGAIDLVLANGFACALLDTNEAACWGSNASGQLGDGTYVSRGSAAPILLDDVDAVATGGTSACARRSDGALHCWGANAYGQLGRGNATPSEPVPGPVPGLGPVGIFGMGTFTACAWTSGLACWGSHETSPVGVPEVTDAVQLALGGEHTCVLHSDGTVSCWGSNDYGQTGTGAAPSVDVPTLVPGLTDIVAIGAGSEHTCAIASDGAVWCWGRNDTGQVGDGTLETRTTPVQVSLPAPAPR